MIREICHPETIPNDVERAYHCIKANTVGEFRFLLHFNDGQGSYPIEYTMYIEEVLGEESCSWPMVRENMGGRRP